MEESLFVLYIQDEIEEMQRHKWIESEKAGYDLGDDAVTDWIKKYSKLFRETWTKQHNCN